jgi:hypothetical protein
MNRATQVKLAAVNILRVYEVSGPETRAKGAAWYPGAAALLAEIAERTGKSAHGVIGAAAAISPGMNWDLVPLCVAKLAKRERVSIPTYSRDNVRKARDCLKGADPLTVLGGPKVRAFYACIAGLDPRAVCVDGHAARIARALPGSIRGEGAADARVTAYQYDLIADAYRLAADAEGVPPHAMQAITWLAWKGGASTNLEIPF